MVGTLPLCPPYGTCDVASFVARMSEATSGTLLAVFPGIAALTRATKLAVV